ncbi:hypothetical protein MMC31_001386 [Peltigera leucophlebia]|nr:hypothetical protein [Peltigera leucophlebia]
MAQAAPMPSQRRGIPLPLIQTTCKAKASHRSKPNSIINEDYPTFISPTQDSLPLNRQRSGSSLLTFLGWSKASNRSSHRLDVAREIGEIPRQSFGMRDTRESSQTRASLLSRELPAASPRSATTTITMQRRTSTSQKNPKLDSKDVLARSLGSWDPPELFKAYPQSIKHARLRAPALHIKGILHQYEEKKPGGLEQGMAQNVEQFKRYVGRKKEKELDLKQRILENNCWAEKIYVLATSGHLLEYAGEGPFDRFPEKLMPLGSESVAFASDAIPGEHWVLQVSRIASDDGTASSAGSKPIFKKLWFGNHKKRSTSTFLLVFDNPDDMNSWLVVIRKEIEALGGKKYRPDVDVLKTADEAPKELRERPSRQDLVKRDPNRFADETNHPASANSNQIGTSNRRDLSTTTLKRQSMATQESVESPSLSNATVSTDQAQLERLKETPRASYVSAGGRTMSRASSLEPSPARAAFSPEDLIPKPIEIETKSDFILKTQTKPLRRSIYQMPLPSQKERPDALGDIKPSRTKSIASQKQRTDALGDVKSLWTNSIASPKKRTDGLGDRKSSRTIFISEPKAARPPSPISPNSTIPTFSKRYSVVTNPVLISPTEADYKEGRPQLAKNEALKSSAPQPQSSQERMSPPRRPLPSLRSKFSVPYTGSRFSRSSVVSDVPTTPRPPKPDPSPSRRFSSLDYGGNPRIRISEQAHSSSPHPPPTISLPPLPVQHLVISDTESYQDRRFQGRTPEESREIRRPVSMQAQTEGATRPKYRLLQKDMQNPSESDEFSLSARPKSLKPHRAPPPPPLILVPQLGIRIREDPLQATKTPPDAFLQEMNTSFLNLEHSPLLPGSWNSSQVGGQASGPE